MKTKIIRSIEELDHLEEQWDGVDEGCSFFGRFAWIRNYSEIYRENRCLFIVVLYSSDTIICIAPLMITKYQSILGKVRVLELIGQPISDSFR